MTVQSDPALSILPDDTQTRAHGRSTHRPSLAERLVEPGSRVYARRKIMLYDSAGTTSVAGAVYPDRSGETVDSPDYGTPSDRPAARLEPYPSELELDGFSQERRSDSGDH